MSWIMPFPDSKITGHYGTLSEYRKKMGMQPHSGTDWAARAGTLIPSIADSEVVLIQFSKVLGWVVVTKTDDGWYLGYCHLYCSYHGAKCSGGHESPLKQTKLGDRVKAGQKFLKVGNSGSATTGAHLHATASRQLKGVFGVTKQKHDLYKLIKEKQQGKLFEPVSIKKAQKPLEITCPNCKAVYVAQS